MRCLQLWLVLVAVVFMSARAESAVRLMRTPDGGIQPQAVVDSDGCVHLLYYKGKPAAGDIFYIRSNDGGSTFSTPLRINSEKNTAVAVGTIRGPHLAVGKNQRIHVAWNGSRESIPVDQRKEHGHAPMLYTRMNDDGSAFEKQRTLMVKTYGLDGGGSVAADDRGNVYVAWHGLAKGKPMREQDRAVWVARSNDNGQSFAAETQANSDATGVCGCCGMRAAVDGAGRLLLMYRAAQQFINRDMHLLVSDDQGRTFKNSKVDRWRVGKCPMSSVTITSTKQGPVLAWESDQRVYLQRVSPTGTKVVGHKTMAVSIQSAKHPTVATNDQGQTLFVWTEGTGWKRGGAVAWQAYTKDGKPINGEAGRTAGVPVWSYACAFATKDGFVIVY